MLLCGDIWQMNSTHACSSKIWVTSQDPISDYS